MPCIITRRFNDPHREININNAQHIVDKTWRHWGGEHPKKTPGDPPLGL